MVKLSPAEPHMHFWCSWASWMEEAAIQFIFSHCWGSNLRPSRMIGKYFANESALTQTPFIKISFNQAWGLMPAKSALERPQHGITTSSRPVRSIKWDLVSEKERTASSLCDQDLTRGYSTYASSAVFCSSEIKCLLRRYHLPLAKAEKFRI